MVQRRAEESIVYQSQSREASATPLPGLMEDVRATAQLQVETPEGMIYINPPATPTVRKQMLIVPDQHSGASMASVDKVPRALLDTTFSVAGDIAKFYEAQSTVKQIDIMVNRSPSPANSPKWIQSQLPLHVHVLGYTEEDSTRPIDRQEIVIIPVLRSQADEILHSVIHDLLSQQVYPELAKYKAFTRLFKQVQDVRGYITYQLMLGAETFADPDLAEILQVLHTQSQTVYNEVARCYFATDLEKGQFVEHQGGAYDGEFVLLEESQRVEAIERYLELHPDLSPNSQRWMRFLATNVDELADVVERKTGKTIKNLPSEEKKKSYKPFCSI